MIVPDWFLSVTTKLNDGAGRYRGRVPLITRSGSRVLLTEKVDVLAADPCVPATTSVGVMRISTSEL